MRKQKFRHRSLESGLSYQSPPSINPFTADFDVFNDKLINSQRGLGAAITIDCNVGGDISTLICKNLQIDKESDTSEANSKQIYDELKRILNERIEPTIFVDANGERFTVSAFDLGMEMDSKFSTLDAAIEDYISNLEPVKKEVKSSDQVRVDHQNKAIEKYNVKSKIYREKGNIIFSKLNEIQKMIDFENDEDEVVIELDDTKILSGSSQDAFHTMKLVSKIYFSDKDWRNLYNIENPEEFTI